MRFSGIRQELNLISENHFSGFPEVKKRQIFAPRAVPPRQGWWSRPRGSRKGGGTVPGPGADLIVGTTTFFLT